MRCAVRSTCGKRQAGEYGVSILVGDPTAPNAIAYALGTVELMVAGGADPALVVRTASFQPLNNIKPEIAHIFVSERQGRNLRAGHPGTFAHPSPPPPKNALSSPTHLTSIAMRHSAALPWQCR